MSLLFPVSSLNKPVAFSSRRPTQAASAAPSAQILFGAEDQVSLDAPLTDEQKALFNARLQKVAGALPSMQATTWTQTRWAGGELAEAFQLAADSGERVGLNKRAPEKPGSDTDRQIWEMLHYPKGARSADLEIRILPGYGRAQVQVEIMMPELKGRRYDDPGRRLIQDQSLVDSIKTLLEPHLTADALKARKREVVAHRYQQVIDYLTAAVGQLANLQAQVPQAGDMTALQASFDRLLRNPLGKAILEKLDRAAVRTEQAALAWQAEQEAEGDDLTLPKL